MPTRRERRRRRLDRQDRRARRGFVRRAFSALVTTVYTGIAAVLLALALAPHAAWAEWRVDLLAQFSAHAAAATIAVGLWWALWRRWRLVTAAAAALALHGAVLLPGRAGWASPELAAELLSSGEAGSVRVLQYNAFSSNRDVPSIIELFLTSDADVASLLEPSYDILAAGFGEGQLKGAYPYFDQHERGRFMGWRYLLSKWPIREFAPPSATTDPHGPESSTAIAVVVERPGGAFGVILVHPQSPRNPGRWRQGNELVDRTIPIINAMEAAGLPVVVLADMNSTPSGLRNQRIVSRTSLGRAKPLLRMEGTYPASWEWPRRIAIDDAWVSPDIKVTGWQTVGPAGSDHMGVIVDLLVPRGVENQETPDLDPYEQFGLP